MPAETPPGIGKPTEAERQAFEIIRKRAEAGGVATNVSVLAGELGVHRREGARLLTNLASKGWIIGVRGGGRTAAVVPSAFAYLCMNMAPVHRAIVALVQGDIDTARENAEQLRELVEAAARKSIECVEAPAWSSAPLDRQPGCPSCRRRWRQWKAARRARLKSPPR